MLADAAARRVPSSPSSQCMTLQTSEAWTEPLAVPRTQGSTGGGTACQACFLSEEQRKPAEPRQRQAQPMQVHATQARYTSAPYPIAGPPHIIKAPNRRRSTKGACLIHGRHARRVPAPYVLIERRCRIERLRQRSDRGNVPVADVLVEGRCSIEHICQVRHRRHIPPPDVLVECRRRLEHRA
jgi:hypothetical protein